MLTKQLDATIVAGDAGNQWSIGVLCYTNAARNFMDRYNGHWQNDTFWVRLPDFLHLVDLTMDMIKAGLTVE